MQYHGNEVDYISIAAAEEKVTYFKINDDDLLEVKASCIISQINDYFRQNLLRMEHDLKFVLTDTIHRANASSYDAATMIAL